MNSEADNASLTSAGSDKETEDKQAGTGPRELAREELSSLQMLEESAAQLAALRQRAESLLEQLASGADSVASSQEPEGSQPVPAGRATAKQESSERQNQMGRSTPETVPQAESVPGDAVAPSPTDQSSDPSGPVGHAAESHHEQQPTLQQSAPPTSESPPRSDRQSRSAPEVEQYAMENRSYDQSGLGPAGQPEAQEQQYPIQSVQRETESLLDSPVTVVRQQDRLRFEVAPEFLSPDAQLIEDEIAGLYEAIDRFRETRRENTGHALSLLREARDIISGQPHRIERAQYNIQQARQIIERARSSRRRARGIAFRTFGLLILWLAALGGLGAALYLYPLEVNEFIAMVSASTGWNTSHYYPLLWTVATGGIGGCLGTISFLFERMRVHEDFDRQYILRSVIQPLMGIFLGLISYGLLVVLFNSLDASIVGHPVTTYLPAALALPIGLWQVYVYAAIFRVTRLLTFQRRRRW